MLYWVPSSSELQRNCETCHGSKMENEPHKNRCFHKCVVFKPCHPRLFRCHSAICHSERELCVSWFIFAWPRLTWHKPYLSESQFVIKQHSYTAKGNIDRALNPQRAPAKMLVGGMWIRLLILKQPDKGTVTSLWCKTRVRAATHTGWHIYAEVREKVHPFWLIDWKKLARCTNRE